MMTFRFFLVGMMIFFSVKIVTAQTSKQDILYLKNGSIIRGTIIEFIPDKTVKIQIADSSIFIFPSLEIEKVVNEENPSIAQTESDSTSLKKDNNITASIFGGVAIPGSDFADVAVTGYTLGFQLHSKKEIGVLFNISYSRNSSPADEGWISFIILVGLKVSLQKTYTNDLYIAPVLGLYVQKFPMINSSAAAVAYGAMLEYQYKARIGIGARFVASNPEYKFNNVSAPLYTSMTQIFITFSL